jgi:hypothetical protein
MEMGHPERSRPRATIWRCATASTCWGPSPASRGETPDSSLTIKHEQNKDGKTREKIDSISRLDPEDDKPPVGELDEVYWDWTQGTDVPKRIDYFWQRAAENPNRRSEPAPVGVGVGAGNGAHLIPAAGDDDIPY